MVAREQNLVEKALAKEDGFSFFQWFTETGSDDELAQLLRDEIYADPLMFFGREVRTTAHSHERELIYSHCYSRSLQTTRTARMMARRRKKQRKTTKRCLSVFLLVNDTGGL